MNEPSLSSKANLISISSGPWALLLKLLAHFFPAKRDRQSTSRLVFAARLRPEFRMPPVRGPVVRIRGMIRTQEFWIHTSLSSTAAARRHTGSTAAARYDWREVAGMANFKMYLLRQFCSNRVELFFTIHRSHRRKK